MTAPNPPAYDVDLTKVMQRLLSIGGETSLQAQLAMHAVALEDAHARIAELEATKPE